MGTNNSAKNMPLDWHNADIIAALKKRDLSLAELSRRNGYRSNGLKNALARRYPKAERIIANAIGVTPQEIWPTRYHKSFFTEIN